MKPGSTGNENSKPGGEAMKKKNKIENIAIVGKFRWENKALAVSHSDNFLYKPGAVPILNRKFGKDLYMSVETGELVHVKSTRGYKFVWTEGNNKLALHPFFAAYFLKAMGDKFAEGFPDVDVKLLKKVSRTLKKFAAIKKAWVGASSQHKRLQRKHFYEEIEKVFPRAEVESTLPKWEGEFWPKGKDSYQNLADHLFKTIGDKLDDVEYFLKRPYDSLFLDYYDSLED